MLTVYSSLMRIWAPAGRYGRRLSLFIAAADTGADMYAMCTTRRVIERRRAGGKRDT